ncbi:MAG: hypothetical protein ABJB17_13075 [Burkholderiales bacterium]
MSDTTGAAVSCSILVVGHYQPLADGDALHITRTKASSAVGKPEDTRKTASSASVVFLVCSTKHSKSGAGFGHPNLE